MQAPSLKQQQQNRARRIIALVPRVGAKSDLDDGDSSADELQHYHDDRAFRTNASDSSSPPPSLPSSLINLNILDSDDDEELGVVLASTSLQTFQSSSTVSAASKSIFPLPLARSSPVPSPRIQFDHYEQVPSPLSEPLPSPHPIALATYEQVPSPLSVPSPAAATRSKKAKVVVMKKRVIKPTRLEPKWSCKKFTGVAEIEDGWFDKANIGFTPIEYFKLFFSDDIITLLVQQTNLYSTQIKGSPINITEDDIKDFLAILVLMGIVKMPAYTDYWSTKCRYEKVAGVMTLKKFQSIRKFLHFNDNLRDDGDRYYKIRPLLQIVRANCLKVEEETRFSVDEMMVPHKGTRAGSRKQYIKNKPKKWGFKIFVRAGVSGIVYDFLVYGGEDTFRFNTFSEQENSMGLGAKVVLALAHSIHQPACKIICFDNFFTSIELLHRLREVYGIFSVGTIRQNRLRGAENKLPTDKNLKKRGRGSHAQVVCNKNKIAVVKWFDNKCVTAATSYLDSRPVQVVMRYKKEERRKVPVTCPNIIKQYNYNMGGVDLADMLIALYRTPFRGHRWYLPLFSQMIDICINNAWLLYRRDHQKDLKPICLKKFRMQIHEGLLKFERTPSNTAQTVPPISSDKIIKAPAVLRPPDAIRFDQIGHMPVCSPKGRCKFCSKGQTRISCQKCKLRLCLVPERNCYLLYHSK